MGDSDLAFTFQVFWPIFDPLNHWAFPLWPAGVAQISFQNLDASPRSGDNL